MSDPNEPGDALERLKRFQIGDIVPSDGQTIHLSFDGAAFMKWLEDYSRELGGIPITVRPPRESGGPIGPPKAHKVGDKGPETIVPQPKPDEDQEGSGEVNGGH